jgi:cyclic dehypoxanthinyl futalosine synthase
MSMSNTDVVRIEREEALDLLLNEDFIKLGQRADKVRATLHPERTVGFVIDRNVNYSNVCTCQCRFCAFYKKPGDPEGYLLESDEIMTKVKELIELGGTQLLLQGGIHPDLDISWFETLFITIKKAYPTLTIHSLSPAEIVNLQKLSKLTLKETLTRLRAAGLDSIPGGGAEVLVDRIRSSISPNKLRAKGWLEVMEVAHNMGMRTTATLMFGAGEKPEELIEHLFRIRELQDKTGGFTAFIPWTFQPTNTELEATSAINPVGGVGYLRTLAVARLVLDNVENIQASWVTQGDKVAQVALSFGANDMGSTMLEENVVAAAGVKFRISIPSFVELIRDSNCTPVKRLTDYTIVERF